MSQRELTAAGLTAPRVRQAYAACLDGTISDAPVALAIWRAWALLHGGDEHNERLTLP